MLAIDLRKPAIALLFGGMQAVALADSFVWQPVCDDLWQGCCDLDAVTKVNNWGRTSPAPVCPTQPGAGDDVVINGPCVVGPTPLPSVSAGTLTQGGGSFMLNHGLGVTNAVFNGPVTWDAGGEIGRATGTTGQALCNGGINIVGPGPKSIAFFGNFTLINAGIGTWTGTGDLTIGMIPGGCCPAIFRNDAGATFSVQTNAPILQTAFGFGRIENHGTIVKENSNGTSQWTAALDNSGLVHVKTGELKLLAGGTADGDFLVDAGATLSFSGSPVTLLPGVDISGAGAAIVRDSNTGFSIAINSDVTIGRLSVASTGRIGDTGLMRISDLLTVENGGDVNVNTRILPAARLECVGAAEFWFHNLEIAGLAHIPNACSLNPINNGLTVRPGGAIQIEDGGLLQPLGNGVQPIENHGLIRKMSGGGDGTIASAFNWYLHNHADGRVQVDGGSLISFNNLEQRGQIDVAAGAEFRQRAWANYYAGSSITGDGWYHLENAANNFIEDGFTLVIPRLRMSGNPNGGAGISGPGNLTITHEAEFRGGVYNGPLMTVQPGVVVNVNGPDFSGAWGTVEHFGTTHSNGAEFYYGVFNNRPGATVDLHADYYFGGRFGGTFNNEGTIRKSGGSGDSDFGGTVNNNGGQVLVQTGRIRANSFVQSAGTTQFNGTGIRCPDMRMTGGTLSGAATLTAFFTNSGGTFEPGGPTPGLVNINGDGGVFSTYAQGAGGTVKMQIGGTTPATGHDQLLVANNISLAGTLSLQLVNGYVPSLGDSFVIMSCGGVRSGQFAQISGTQIGGGKQFSVSYNPQNVTLTVVAGGSTPGDLDGDGHVSLQDLASLLASFGICAGQAGYNASADLDGDGCVAISDLAILLSNFGN